MAVGSDYFEGASLGNSWNNGPDNWNDIYLDATNDIIHRGTNGQCVMVWTGDTFADDQFSQVTIETVQNSTSDYAQSICRANPATAESYIGVAQPQGPGNGVDFWIEEYDGASTYTNISSGGTKNQTGVTLSQSDTVRLEAQGTTLRLYYNETLVSVASDATWTSGSVGPGISGGAGATQSSTQYTAWYGGDLSDFGVDYSDTVLRERNIFTDIGHTGGTPWQ